MNTRNKKGGFFVFIEASLFCLSIYSNFYLDITEHIF
jgi:hypothetical protein